MLDRSAKKLSRGLHEVCSEKEQGSKRPLSHGVDISLAQVSARDTLSLKFRRPPIETYCLHGFQDDIHYEDDSDHQKRVLPSDAISGYPWIALKSRHMTMAQSFEMKNGRIPEKWHSTHEHDSLASDT